MHICLVTEHFPVRSETFIRLHALGLIQRGHLVTVVSAGVGEDISNEEIQTLQDAGIRCFICRNLQGHILCKLWRLIVFFIKNPLKIRYLQWSPPFYLSGFFWVEALEKLNPDIIHVHFGGNAKMLYRRGLKKKVVITWHGADANVAPKLYGENIYYGLFKQKWLHTIGSSFMRKRLIALGAPEKQLSVIPMGIDLAAFPYRQRSLKNGNPMRILSVGRLDEVKGQRYLIQAVEELLREGINVILEIVGEGNLRKDLQAQIEKNENKNHIRLIGALTSTEVAQEMSKAHVFALTGVVAANGAEESQGVVFAEAQASGLPVIASSIGGVSESLLDGKSGFLCPPGDVKAIKNAIRFFYDNPDEIRNFGKQGRQFVEQQFSHEQMLQAFEDIYKNL